MPPEMEAQAQPQRPSASQPRGSQMRLQTATIKISHPSSQLLPLYQPHRRSQKSLQGHYLATRAQNTQYQL